MKWILKTSLVKFLLVGVANTAVGLSVIWVSREILREGDTLSNMSGYIVGVAVSFLLNKRWTFSFSGEGGSSLLRFVSVFGVSYAINLGTVLGLILISGVHTFWWQVCGTLPYSAVFYVGCRWYVFPLARERGAARNTAAW